MTVSGTVKPAKREAAPEAEAEEVIPEGFDACYVAIPGRVSRGDGKIEKADVLERLIGPSRTIDELQLRGLAFRDKSEAEVVYKQHVRKIEEKKREALAALNAKRARLEQSALNEIEALQG